MKGENWLIDMGVTVLGVEVKGEGAEETMPEEAKTRSTSLKFIGNELRGGRLQRRRDTVGKYRVQIFIPLASCRFTCLNECTRNSRRNLQSKDQNRLLMSKLLFLVFFNYRRSLTWIRSDAIKSTRDVNVSGSLACL